MLKNQLVDFLFRLENSTDIKQDIGHFNIVGYNTSCQTTFRENFNDYNRSNC
jgi:hypothetical protein